jgi:hypothetical protein
VVFVHFHVLGVLFELDLLQTHIALYQHNLFFTPSLPLTSPILVLFHMLSKVLEKNIFSACLTREKALFSLELRLEIRELKVLSQALSHVIEKLVVFLLLLLNSLILAVFRIFGAGLFHRSGLEKGGHAA